jgi:hypothetical protein
MLTRSGFLAGLVNLGIFGTLSPQQIQQTQKLYLLQFFVAGFKHYQGMQLLSNIKQGDYLTLTREPENPHDSCAIALYWQQTKIGYVPAADNQILSRLLDANALPLLAQITHINTHTQPWENLAVAIFILQPHKAKLPQHAQYLKTIFKPNYTTKKKTNDKHTMHNQLFETTNRLVDINAITNPKIRRYFKKHIQKTSNQIFINGKQYTQVIPDDIYTFLYEVNPLNWAQDAAGEWWLIFNMEGYHEE